jgi:hypothetical protein
MFGFKTMLSTMILALIVPYSVTAKTLTVKVTCYTSTTGQNDNRPFEPAFTNEHHGVYTAEDKDKAVAVSRMMLTDYGLKGFQSATLEYHGTTYHVVVRDKKNARYTTPQVDLYKYLSHEEAKTCDGDGVFTW